MPLTFLHSLINTGLQPGVQRNEAGPSRFDGLAAGRLALWWGTGETASVSMGFLAPGGSGVLMRKTQAAKKGDARQNLSVNKFWPFSLVSGRNEGVEKQIHEPIEQNKKTFCVARLRCLQKTANFHIGDQAQARANRRGLEHSPKGASRCLCKGCDKFAPFFIPSPSASRSNQ